jgi:hypothetical protein
MGMAQGPTLLAIGRQMGFACEVCQDLSGRERFFLAQRAANSGSVACGRRSVRSPAARSRRRERNRRS